MKSTAALLFVILHLSGTFPRETLSSETLRGTFKGVALPDAAAITLSLEDLLQIDLPESTKFTKALEIEVQIPRELLPYRSNFAVFLYQNFQAPQSGVSAKGDRLSIEVLPPSNRFYLQIPLIARANLKAAIDTAVIKTGANGKIFPVGLTILPIDKGLPSELQKVQFQVKTRFLNANLGGLNLQTPNLTPELRKNLKITANGVSQPSEGTLYLEPGLYTIEASLPGYSTQTVNVAVSQAKVSDLTMTLEEEKAQVVFEAPEGAVIFLDGKKIAWTSITAFPIEKGVHTVQFIIGNSQVTDNFEITKGGQHKVSLVLRIAVDNE